MHISRLHFRYSLLSHKLRSEKGMLRFKYYYTSENTVSEHENSFACKILAKGQILTTTLGLGRHHVLGLRRFLFTYYSHGSSFPLLHPDPDSHHHIFSILNTLLTTCWNSKSSQYVCWHGQSADVQCIVWRSCCPELIIK